MEWKEVKLGEIYEVHNGLSKGAKFFGSGYPFLTFSNVFNNYFLPEELTSLVQTTDKERESCSIKEGDVFITRTSETAEELGMSSVALKDYPNATYNGFTKRLRIKEDCIFEVNSSYIGYYLRSKRFRNNFYMLSGGMSTRASLSNGDLLKMTISLPPLDTQRRIASILSSLDAKIENNNKINAKLEEIASNLFKNWFVDFAPFADSEFEDSELGMIPKGWKVGKLGDVATLIKKSINPGKTPNKIFSHYSIPAFDAGKSPVKQQGEEIMSNKFTISNKVTLLSKLNPHIKRIWYVDKVDDNPICSTEFLPFQANNMNHSAFLYSFLNSDYFYNSVAQMVNGATSSHQRLDAKLLLNFDFAYNLDALSEFNKVIEPMLTTINTNIQESSRLATLRDTLLPKLMSGEIELDESNDIS